MRVFNEERILKVIERAQKYPSHDAMLAVLKALPDTIQIIESEMGTKYRANNNTREFYLCCFLKDNPDVRFTITL